MRRIALAIGYDKLLDMIVVVYFLFYFYSRLGLPLQNEDPEIELDGGPDQD